jgi:hypothetical protein
MLTLEMMLTMLDGTSAELWVGMHVDDDDEDDEDEDDDEAPTATAAANKNAATSICILNC